ncbi:response regulator transcription factor [Leptolyngbya sp. 7M]|uniref:response regulator transcription factor n=1 Tax=Leptolyngbya sp. 7M TaxID=2812896 RepID=UPI001B8C24DC|nr:response regulator transcription factor [Leptolyngbya sp. 7M]QYO67044.1 response regulator transcription factor [Leptolyngbya sp. 7M]
MSETHKILVVDDEPQITRVLRHSLVAHRFDIRTSADGISALDTFHDWHPDLIITDLQMPEMDGIELCRQIRKISRTPIIILSVKGEERTKVEALDAGADDYVTKPFGIDELLARVRAALRRVPIEHEETRLIEGDILIDPATREVIIRGSRVYLTPKEYDLLLFFFRNRGKVLTHRTILAAVWGGNFTEQNEYLRVLVGQLRKKIEADPTKPALILTEPWIGYRFNTSA